MSTEKRFFEIVDVLRAIAAVSVIIVHTIHHASWTAFPTTGALSWFRNGSYGVDLFFVISGFVVLHTSLAQRELYGTSFLKAFTIRRLARIIPLYYLTLLAALFTSDATIINNADLYKHITYHVFFIHTFDWTTFSSIKGPNWSIGLELQFYALIALVTPFLFSRAALAPILLLILILIAIIWRGVCYAYFLPTETPIEHFLLFVRSSQLPGRLDQFGLGMAIALFIRTSMFEVLRSSPLPTIFALYTLGASILWLYFGWHFTSGNPVYDGAYFRTIVAAAFALFVLGACLVENKRFIQATRIPRYLGEISYGLYLWHLPALITILRFDLSPSITLLLTLTTTSLLSIASWHIFEKPITKWAKSWPLQETTPLNNRVTQSTLHTSPAHHG